MERAACGEVSEHVLRKFPPAVDGELRNERLEREREKQSAFRESRSINGAKGGRPKVNNNLVVSGSLPLAKPTGKAKKSSPSPSSSPSSISSPAPVSDKDSPSALSSEHQITIERWMAYSEKRTGNKYPFNGRDAKAVQTLLAHFETADAVGQFIKSVHARSGYPFDGQTGTLHDIANNLGRLQDALSRPPQGTKSKPTEAERDAQNTGLPPQQFNLKKL